MKTLLLIDADMYVYQVAAAGQTDVEFDGVPMSTSDFTTCLTNFDYLIDDVMEKMEADQFILALSDPKGGNFRKGVLPTYKHGRVGLTSPLVRRQMEEYLIERRGAKTKPGLEGDDILGIWSTGSMYPGFHKIVVSGDKDMKTTVPGFHWNPRSDKPDVVTFVSEQAANYGHMYQTLTGDYVDGYTGIPGIGPKKAEKILADYKDMPDSKPMRLLMWRDVVRAYVSKGLEPEDALVQARCARILRAEDYDFTKKRPILWSPPR